MRRSENKLHDIIDWNQRDNLQLDWHQNTKNLLNTLLKILVRCSCMHLFDQKCRNNINIVKYYFFFSLRNSVIYSCDGKAELSALLPQSSVSHDPSEIIIISWFGPDGKKKSIINVKNSLIFEIEMCVTM